MFLDKPKITFLCVTFVYDIIITGADDGYFNILNKYIIFIKIWFKNKNII